ncbi:MAG: hypothetical protein M3527_01705 [Actinomycetota bacterium]|nr:hypothetical protein [Acidimicrobiia bacterium]MDQ3293157.1 hypothetical protein [Actinomycetota bacterium]
MISTGRVTVKPEEFKLVEFDRAEIVAVIERLLDAIGLDRPVVLDVDQTTPLGATSVESVDPIVIHAQSGALEDPRRLRQLSPSGAAQNLGRLLIRVADRLDPAFTAGGEPPADSKLTLLQHEAWDTYALGRLVRLGFTHHADRQSALYRFRTRHGFTDGADERFDALWRGSGLTWGDIDRLSAEAAAVTAA